MLKTSMHSKKYQINECYKTNMNAKNKQMNEYWEQFLINAGGYCIVNAFVLN